jgi:RNA polymerase sigma factor (sigma-70 family)
VIDEDSDALVTVRCQLGEQDAWEILVRRWHPRLWRFVSRMVPDGAVADDVLQTVWLRVVRSLAQLREPDRLGAWLLGIARRTVADQFRERYRRPPTEEIGEIAVLDSEIETRDAIDAIEAGLVNLHPTDRETVVLYYLEEMPLGDVAEICGVPPGTVKSRLHRARRIIKSNLTGLE